MALTNKGNKTQAAIGAIALLALIWLFVPFNPAVYDENPHSSSGAVKPSNNIIEVPQDTFNSSSNRDEDQNPFVAKDQYRPLILYVYAESETARENIKFFIHQGLHGAADFVFILNGVEDDNYLEIPQKPNIRVVKRPNTCYDLGAYGEVLRHDGLWQKYSRFIMLNASIRGPFLPYWSKACWSDLYLGKLTGKVKLVGMTANCWPRLHVQSMIWATDAVGISLLLSPPAAAGRPDQFGGADAPVGLAGCYGDWGAAVHAEVGSTAAVTQPGYDVDVMMAAYHGTLNYVDECAFDAGDSGDVLFQGKYYGANVHPYETVFIKTNRDIDPVLIQRLTEWHATAGTNSWDVCKGE